MEELRIGPRHYLTCLWPGLSELWWRGRIAALPAAIAFTAVVNVLLVARFFYEQWLAGPLVSLACWILFATWCVLTIRSIRELPLLLTPRAASETPDRFPEAQAAFLRGDYDVAETVLTAALKVEPRDPPSLLLLASVYRHTGRLHAAELLLKETGRIEAADAWQLEWRAENERLRRDREEASRVDDQGVENSTDPASADVAEEIGGEQAAA
ncbi:MAG: tetratricopeptide repeat protein [Planctomycetota bacterium]